MKPSTKNALKYGDTIALTAVLAWRGRKNKKISSWMSDFDEHEIDFAEELLHVWDAGGPTLTAYTMATAKKMIYESQGEFEKSGMSASDFRKQVDDMFDGITKDIEEKLSNGNRRLGVMSDGLRGNFLRRLRGTSLGKEANIRDAEVVELENRLGRILAKVRRSTPESMDARQRTDSSPTSNPAVKRIANVTPLKISRKKIKSIDELDGTEVSALLKDELMMDIGKLADPIHPVEKERFKIFASGQRRPTYQEMEVVSKETKRMVSQQIAGTLMEQFSLDEIIEGGEISADDPINPMILNPFLGIQEVIKKHNNASLNPTAEPVEFWYVPDTGTIETKRPKGLDGNPEKYTAGWVPFLYPSEEGNRALYESAATELVRQWQVTSNDSNPFSLRIQDVTREAFGLNDALGWKVLSQGRDGTVNADETAPLPISPAQKKLLTAFVKAQYDQTQEYLKQKGIKKLTVYRGYFDNELVDRLDIMGVDDPDGGITDTLQLRPLSSFSIDSRIAAGFGPVVIESTINAEDIFALPLTGSGCLGESEVIVLGRSGLNGTVRAKYAFLKRVAEMQGVPGDGSANLFGEYYETADTGLSF